MKTRIGISGWRYTPWRGVFYPKGLPTEKELSFASNHLKTIEINGTFYSLQTPERFKTWYASTPKNFVFAVKGPRYITHIKRLKDCESPLGNFFGSGVLHLKEKLGPFLWQLPPNFIFNDEVLETFLSLLPKTMAKAVKLSRKADRVTPDFPKDVAKSKEKLRHALEIRNPSFENPFFIELLQRYNIALVFADTAGRWPYMEDMTADFLYLRLHGDEELYKSGYDDATLRWWASRLRLWQQARQPNDALTLNETKMGKKPDIYVYFDNDVKVKAPFDAQRLAHLLKSSN